MRACLKYILDVIFIWCMICGISQYHTTYIKTKGDCMGAIGVSSYRNTTNPIPCASVVWIWRHFVVKTWDAWYISRFTFFQMTMLPLRTIKVHMKLSWYAYRYATLSHVPMLMMVLLILPSDIQGGKVKSVHVSEQVNRALLVWSNNQ